MKTYHIEYDVNPDALAERVTDLLNDGWKPLGGLVEAELPYGTMQPPIYINQLAQVLIKRSWR